MGKTHLVVRVYLHAVADLMLFFIVYLLHFFLLFFRSIR